MKKIVFVVVLFFVWQMSDAQIVTDRPTQGISSSTVGGGNFQVEMGTQVGMSGADRETLLPITAFRYGITSDIELMLVHSYKRLNASTSLMTAHAFNDLEIAAKAQIFQSESSKSEVAFMTKLVTPTATPNGGSDYGTVNTFTISHVLNDKLGLGYNIGHSYFGTGNGNLNYTLALGISINDKTSIFVEPYGEYTNLKIFNHNFNTGFTYLVNDTFQVDFSFGTGLTQRMNFIAFGFSWKANKKEE